MFQADIRSMEAEMDLHGEEVEEGLGEMFFRCLSKNGNKPIQFIVDTGETDTSKELLKRSIRVAIKLRQKNIKPGDVIATCTYNHINSCVPLIAAQLIGAITTAFDFNVSQSVVIHLVRLVEPKIIFADSKSAAGIEECVSLAGVDCEVVVFNDGGFSEYLKPNPEEEKFLPYKVKNVKDTAMILFSSGTTGFPKGICLNHYGLKGQILYDRFYSRRVNKPGAQTVYLMYTKLFWSTCIGSLLKSIFYGDAKVICSNFDPVQAWKIIDKYNVTAMFLTPYLAAEFADNRPDTANAESLSVFYTGGTKIHEKLMSKLNRALPHTNVLQFFGQTECAGVIATFSANDPAEIELQRKYPTSFGKIYSFIQWKIVDSSTEQRLGVNQQGELRLKLDYVMNGYYKLDTSGQFDSEGYLKTGDIAYCNEEGCMFMVDRIKELFKCRGMHIVPSVLEDVLLHHPAVKQAVVVGIPHDIDGHHPMGIVTIKEGQSATQEEIQTFYTGKVYELQQLRAGLKIVDEIPLTSTGKVNRNVVRSKILNGKL